MSWSMLGSPIQCICDGRYEGCIHGNQRGTCDNEPGGGTSPYWCVDCDRLRLIDIEQGLKKILAEIEADHPDTPEARKIKMIAESGLDAIQFLQEKEAPGE